MEIDKYEALLEKAKDFNNLRNGGVWKIVDELVEAVEDLLEENSFLAAGTCVLPSGEGLVGDEGGTPYCNLKVENNRLKTMVGKMQGQFIAGWKVAIEAAAQSCLSSAYVGERDGYHFAYTIRAIPMPADAQAAPDRMTAQALAQGMREAADIAYKTATCILPTGHFLSERCRDAILNHVEEIEKEARNE